jgi:hypothetical protein
MTRSDKLHGQLTNLEADFLRLLQNEVDNLAKQGRSRYFQERCGYWVYGYPSEGERELTRLERMITQLRTKLGEELPGPALCVLHRELDRYRQHRTSHRSKLPRGRSYPLTANDIQIAFAELLTTLPIEITFWHSSRVEVACDGSLRVLGLSSYGRSTTFTLWVYDVSSDDRSRLRNAYLPKALSLMRTWMLKERPETWYQDSHTLEVWYRPEPFACRLLECHKRRIVETIEVLED